MISMALHSKIYIGHVETVNLEAKERNSVIESKVVALKLIGFDEISKLPKYKPLRKYKEYYKIISVESLNGLVNDKKINQAIKKTGKQEVQQLKKVA